MLTEVSAAIVKHLNADEKEVNEYLYGNIEVLLTADNSAGQSMLESRMSPEVKPASPKVKNLKASQVVLEGRVNEIYLALKKLRKSVKADK